MQGCSPSVHFHVSCFFGLKRLANSRPRDWREEETIPLPKKKGALKVQPICLQAFV